MCPNELCEACSNYVMRICRMAMAKNEQLKLITFLYRVPVESIKQLSYLLQSM